MKIINLFFIIISVIILASTNYLNLFSGNKQSSKKKTNVVELTKDGDFLKTENSKYTKILIKNYFETKNSIELNKYLEEKELYLVLDGKNKNFILINEDIRGEISAVIIQDIYNFKVKQTRVYQEQNSSYKKLKDILTKLYEKNLDLEKELEIKNILNI